MQGYQILVVIAFCLQCITLLAGIAAGVYGLVNGQRLSAGLALAGFVLMSIAPVIALLVTVVPALNALGPGLVYLCISSGATTIGILAVIAALVFAWRSQMSQNTPM